ncbi:electron transfer flavoprotein subunit beta/FixA family protein [Subtercola frigoramans]|uniref:Electron transfer flavoprotein subunit beta n=1 Tax=Subtercola frigoramans TaxID=120298 RepID=A0ABS2L722_9MICO|nr:electron transfer flavoprotein subunit beta/FixA family protein [Subtercola frigoramans]MBM7472874.1 electron transfer flavoprotein beta subunit [Subtercola frigoramans]
MRIVVLVKEVPDTYGDRTLDRETGLADRSASERVLDEIGERATEVAVSYAEKNPGTEVVVMSMGPETVTTTLRKGLAMGATSAVHIFDDRLKGADLTLTAEVLARAIDTTGFDLVISGNLSTDGTAGMLPAMVAELLGVGHATNLERVEISEHGVSGDRVSDTGTMHVSGALPAVISITEQLPDARFPNFKGIMAAKKKPFSTLSLAELGVDAEADLPRSIVVAVAEKTPRLAGVKIVDEGDGGQQIADFLRQRNLA